MEQQKIIEISGAVPRFQHLQFQEPINWSICQNEHWAIIGANGNGKTLLVDILLGKYALKAGNIICKDKYGKNVPVSSHIKSVSFRDIYGIIDTQNSYYQQRWNRGDEIDIPVVRDLFTNADPTWLNMLLDWFGIKELMCKEVSMLSSGELRKFLLVRSLLSKPRVLIIDNPFIGLDAQSRTLLNDVLKRLTELNDLQIVLVLSNPADIPDMITHVLPVGKKYLYTPCTYSHFLNDNLLLDKLFPIKPICDINALKEQSKNNFAPFYNAAVLRNIHIKYDSRTILNNLDWIIERGDKWALLGVNGSGKTTLLSVICGDNPQAYANDITLFDQKRGSGESIWDIKKRIGYISPEMHLYYNKNVKCSDVVGSGFFDTIGLYRKCSEEQRELAEAWMSVFGMGHLKDSSFLNISSGEQRLVLLARVFVKNPDLLILDEPLHGLDMVNKMRVKKIIEDFCTPDKTLIYVSHYQTEIPNIINKRLKLKKE